MRGVPLAECAAHMFAHRRMAREFGKGGNACPDQLLTTGGIEPAEQRDELAIRARHDGILQYRRTGRERADTQAANLYPGACRELEILGEASVKNDTACRISLVGEAHRIARQIEPFRIERRGGEIGPLPVAR